MHLILGCFCPRPLPDIRRLRSFSAQLDITYANGQGGVEKDYIFAYKWANMAAMNGNEEACMLTELLMHYMTRQEIESSRKLTLQSRSNKL